MQQTGIKVVVGIPMERNVSDKAFIAFWEIARKGWPLIPHGYGRTDLNRNELARMFLESDCTHLVMLDTDHEHPPDTVERLLRWVVDTGDSSSAGDSERLVVGGLHFRRGEPFEPCAFVRWPDGSLHAPVTWPQGLCGVDAIGHGTLLVNRKVFETIPGPWWRYDYSKWDMETHMLPSEDMYFCEQCQAHGIKMWCDTTLTSPHLITASVDESTFRSWLASHPEQVQVAKE